LISPASLRGIQCSIGRGEQLGEFEALSLLGGYAYADGDAEYVRMHVINVLLHGKANSLGYPERFIFCYVWE
jgi:hypothetical protein